MADAIDTPHGRDAVDRDLFDRIRHAQEMAAPFSGVDTSAVARQAVEAYWRNRALAHQAAESRAPVTVAAFDRLETGMLVEARGYALERETAVLLRGSAAAFEGGVWPEFWRDFAVAILPVAGAVGAFWLPLRLGILPPIWVLALAVLGAAAVSLAILYRAHRLDAADLLASAASRWFRLRYSLGAMAAGLIVAALIGAGSYAQAVKGIDLSLALAEDRLSSLALSSLVATHDAGRFRPATIERTFEVKVAAASFFGRTRELFSVTTESMGQAEAVYRACARGVPGELVLQLEATTGAVEWRKAGEVLVRDRFVVGRVQAVDGTGLDLITEEGEHLHLALDGPPSIPITAGRCLVAAFNAETLQVRELQSVGC
jgi:hypothetical protein